MTMARRLLVIRRRLWLRGKGLILEPGVVPLQGERIRAGDRVVLKRPDGSGLETMIRGTITDSGRIHLLLDEANKDEVSVGTEAWSVDP